MMSATHVRMARAALNWTLKDLEDRTGVNKNTISRYEAGAAILSDTLQRIEHVLKAEGVIFIDEDEDLGPGVRLRKGRTASGADNAKRQFRETKPKGSKKSKG